MKPSGINAIFFILLVSFTSVAQQNKIADTTYVDELNMKAWKMRGYDLEKSKQYALQALAEAKKINYTRGPSYSYNMLGHYYKVKGSYDTAFYYFQKSLAIRQKLNDTISIASSLRNIMSIYKVQGNYAKAIETGTTAVKLLTSRSSNPKAVKEKAWIQSNLSSIYLKTGEYKNAMQNALEAEAIFRVQEDDEGLVSAANNFGYIYETQQKYGNALAQYQKAMELNIKLNNQRELAKSYNNIGNVYYATYKDQLALSNYKKGLEIRQLNHYDDDIGGSLLNIAVIYKTLGESDSALQYSSESLKLCLKTGNMEGQYEANRVIGTVLRDKNKYKEAIDHLQKALALSSETNGLPETIELLKEITNTYRAFGKSDSALIYSDRYFILNNSLDKVLRNSLELESSIKRKEYELNISEEKNRSQSYIIFGMSSVIILLSVILFLYFNSHKTKKRMLQLQELIKEQELKTLDAMIEGQESERKRLATELHDTIGSILSAIKFAFKSMESIVIRTNYQKINDMLDEALATVRRISHDMASGVVLEKGIGDALNQLCDMFQETGKLQIKLDMYNFGEKIDSVVELNLYRIIQELLTNILKHSQAQSVSIQLIKSKENINLIVIDDGKGFNPAGINSKHGIGLSNIDKRVQSLSGKWDIDSGKGNGTTIVIDIPLNDNTTNP